MASPPDGDARERAAAEAIIRSVTATAYFGMGLLALNRTHTNSDLDRRSRFSKYDGCSFCSRRLDRVDSLERYKFLRRYGQVPRSSEESTGRD